MRKHAVEPDENQIASRLITEATGMSEKNPFAVGLAKRRAEMLTPERRRQIAKTAAAKRWSGKKKR